MPVIMDRPTNSPSRRVVNAGMTFCLAVTSIGVPGTCEAEPRDYAKIMQAAIRRSLGGDFREYEWVSYPTNNFGIATMYLLDSPRSKPSDKNQWCATYTCLGLEGKRAPADASARLTAGGFADVGTGGPITLSDEESRILAGEVFLPEILNVLGLGAQLAATKNARIGIRMGNVSRRILKKQTLLTYLESLPETSPVRKAMSENRLAIVVADAVVDSLEVNVDTRDSVNSEFGVRLSPLVNRVTGGTSSMQVQVKRDKTGQYRLIIGQPVIVARLTIKRSLTGSDIAPGERATLPADLSGWDTWVPAGAVEHVR